MTATSQNPSGPASPSTDDPAAGTPDPQRKDAPAVEEEGPASCSPPGWRCVQPEPAAPAGTGK
ncbi:hypothetical protein P3T37_004988 [Kitasatospora sp. MAA4]|uniref:hypothetical protein n=1 Tax=Kitasatospora sp. MAA4 TaxID=3035093 RepID=UPI0024736F1B|nr:hypothetical protein [Kitasatospora sp. MAA4]MDH6135572.1 hypothetical protein [Kitasatospora sp. MAA4]